VFCGKHFEDKYLIRGEIRCKLNWNLNPIPSIHTDAALKRPSTVRNPSPGRKAAKTRIFQEDELSIFNQKDCTTSFDVLTEQHSPSGYCCHKEYDFVVYYKLMFQDNGFPIVKEAIKINEDLHVQLQYRGKPVPLPAWFVSGRSAKLNRFSMLDNFSSYLLTVGEKHDECSIANELDLREFYQPKGSPQFSSKMIRFTLLLQYTSATAYRIVKEHLPLPSSSLLEKLRSGKLDALKAACLLKTQNKISEDVMLLVDEMYLQKCVQYAAGEYVGADSDANLYNGIVVFMIHGLKTSLSLVIKACPETKLNGKCLADEMTQCLLQLSSEGFKVRAIISDNHATNVAAFKKLRDSFNSDSPLKFKHPASSCCTYLFFDSVHLLKKHQKQSFKCQLICFSRIFIQF